MPPTDPPPLREIHLLLRLSREWDLRWENLFRTGSVRKWYSSVGNEALTVPAQLALEQGDALASLHRDAGAILSHYVDVRRLFPDLLPSSSSGAPPDPRGDPRAALLELAAQMMGKAAGFTGGYDRSYHFGRIDRERGILHVGMISHLGAMIPVAAGLALALQREGRGRVAINFIGEGGTSTGDFHEGLNLAAVQRLPLILVIENNHYAFSTPEREQHAGGPLVERAAGYGVAGEAVDGGDPEAVWATVRRAAARARQGEGPTLIEADLVRLRGHSEGDDSLETMPPEERERQKRNDPVERFEKKLVEEKILTRKGIESISERIRSLLIEITDEAKTLPDPVPAPRPVYAHPPSPTSPTVPTSDIRHPTSDIPQPSETTYLEAIARALREEMQRDQKVLLLGQDIAQHGGAFKVTRGFLEEFGAERVLNTPISESGTIGAACGAALLGWRPVVEMQFADFITCGFNQTVNVAAKNFWRWGQPVPIVIRCPSGGGAGAGPFHSQCPEAWFLHVPGLKVVAPATPRDALGLLKSAVRDPDPVLFFEHKQLYRRIKESLPAPADGRGDDELLVPIGPARVAREGDDVAVITWSWMVHRALAAAEQLESEGISVLVLDLRTLAPLDEEAILAAARRTGKVLVLHEAPLTGGFGGEIAARIAERAFDALDAPVRRLACPDEPVPYHPTLEASAIPDETRIALVLRELARY